MQQFKNSKNIQKGAKKDKLQLPTAAISTELT